MSFGERTSNARLRVGALAERQCGRVGAYQLRHLGIDSARTIRWADTGYLVPRLPGVYAVGHAAPSIEADLAEAVLYAGPGAGLTHATALWWWGLTGIAPPPPIHVATPRRVASRDGIVVHGRREIERVWHRGLPLATPAQALLAYAADAAFADIRYALAQAEYHQLLDLRELEAGAGQGPAGSVRLRRAIARHEPQLAHTRSRLERAFIELCEDHGLPVPEFNVRIGRMTVDALYSERRLIIELDGGDGHRSLAQMKRDRARELRLRELGYMVVRYSAEQVFDHPALVAQDVRRLLAAP